MNTLSVEAPPRKFVAPGLLINTWQDIKPYYATLNNATINSLSDLQQWLANRSELETVIQENTGWRYIRMTCDTTNQMFADDYTFFITQIEPEIAPENNKLNLKLLASPFLEQLQNTKYANYIRAVKTQVELFKEENIPLIANVQQKQQQYGVIASAQTITVDGKEITLQQAGIYLKSANREKRKEVYLQISNRRLQDKPALDVLFNELLQLRNQIAVNAGFKNFRDYMFAAMNRFDYTVNDCELFHESIKQQILPLCQTMDEQRKQKLGYSDLMPWDTEVDVTGKPSVKPFNTADELVEKTIACFNDVDSELANCIKLLKNLKRLDLDSRKGKAPGGYNYPLYETGVPFIFMNSSGLLRDLVTMVHEGGHAVHSVLTHELDFVEFKNCPSEVAELASMSMELISMEHWHHFFTDKDELKRAKEEHLESLLDILPWVAAIDKFQHWIYTNPNHTTAERNASWTNIFAEYSSTVVNRTGLENITENIWQKQLHIFEVPFYYIEYGMAQLGAIALWKNYKENPARTIEQYKQALSLGYTKTIPDIYKAAGVKFDFSAAYIKSLADFVKEELSKLN